MEEKIKTFSDEGDEENLLPADLPKGMAKGSSLNRKETIKEILDIK